jgi:hypothetical protein
MRRNLAIEGCLENIKDALHAARTALARMEETQSTDEVEVDGSDVSYHLDTIEENLDKAVAAREEMRRVLDASF